MKKTLLALALLVGTGGAFAQIGIKADAIQKAQVRSFDKAMASQSIKTQKQQIANGTKDGEERTLICDFSQDGTYTFGSTSRNGVGGLGFNLQANTDEPFGVAGSFINTWLDVPTDGHWWWTAENWVGRWDIPNTGSNGYAYVSMLDIMDAGMCAQQTLEVTLTFTTPIESFGMNGLDIWFNQLFQKFNADRYFLDWSNDPTFATYDSIEFNIRGIETDVNEFYYGTKRITLPNGTLNANAVAESEDQMTYIRMRIYAPPTGAAGQPHGYFWFLDDFYWSDIPENRIEMMKSTYLTNGYHLIPEGVMLDTLINLSYIENTGGTDYFDAKVENVINKVTFEGEGENMTEIHTYVATNMSDPDTLRNAMTIIDELNDAGVVVGQTQQRYAEFYAWTTPLPSEEEGTYSISTQITSGGNVVDAIDDTTYFSVVGPMVTNDGHYQWAKDRNRLVERGIFRGGYIYDAEDQATYVTDNAQYALEGYEVCLPYTTNANNQTERWIKGVEIVPAMDTCMAGAQIQGKLRKWNNEAESHDETIMDVEDEWGEPVQSYVYNVSAADLNNGLATDPEYLDVIGPDDFKTIYLEFPNSVRLEPGEVYYACYRMASTGKFAVGTDNPQLGTFGPGSGYYHAMMLVCQPNISTNFGWGGSYFWPDHVGGVCPMIRMILGTEASLPENISVASSLNLFPNPANNEASISYTLNKSGNVSIVITDIMGRTVKTMNQGNQVAGEQYNVNLSTSDLANGTYFYTMTVNGEKQTKKFVVNR